MIGIETFHAQTSTDTDPKQEPERVTADVIFPSSDEAEMADVNAALVAAGELSIEDGAVAAAEASATAREYENAYFAEVGDLIPNLSQEAVYAAEIADPSQRERIADSYAAAVELYSEPLNEEQKSDIAKRALKALRRPMPRSQVIKRLSDDNVTANQLVRQRSLELQAKDDDLTDVEKNLKDRRTLLLRQIAELGPAGEVSQQIVSELAFINGILDRKKQTAAIVTFDDARVPTTAELEEAVSHVTPESVSPGRGIDLRHVLAGGALKASDALHKLAEVISPDEVAADEAEFAAIEK